MADNETFIHSVRVVGPSPPRPSGIGPAMSTPYQPTRDHGMDNTSMSPQPPTPPTPLTIPDEEIQLRHLPQQIHQGYRLAASIQRFNDKFPIWLAWFRHFPAVADVHGWSKDQKALQLVSYLDEAVNNATYTIMMSWVKRLSNRFDPASRVLPLRSRFHGRSHHHHEYADAFADAYGLRRKGNSRLLLKFVRTSPA